jgi:GNAT superfamily N-acetyltransferase
MMVTVPEAVCIRSADARDVAALAALRAASLVEMGLLGQAEVPAFLPRARRELARLFQAERLCAWVLEVDGVLAGCACVVTWDRLPYPGASRHAEVAGVYVAPAHRRRGYARELVGEAIAGASALGVRRLLIAPTELTRRFYHSFGFDDAGWLRSPLFAK